MKFLKWTLIILLLIGMITFISIEGYSKYKLGLISPKKEVASDRYAESVKDSFWVSYGETDNIEIKPYSLTEFISRFLFMVIIYENGDYLNHMPRGSGLTYDLTRNIYSKQKLNMSNWHVDSAIVSSWVSKNYTAEEALNLIIESQYFSKKSVGFNQAAVHYFDVAPSNLTLNQIITLVAISHAPSLYTDCYNKPKLILRAEYITSQLKKYNASKYSSFQFRSPSFTARDGSICE